MSTSTSKNKLQWYVLLLSISMPLIIIYAYTFLHESGHGLIGLLYGGKIDQMILGFKAHIRISNASYTPLGHALQHSFGTLLPIVFLFSLLVFYNRSERNLFYQSFYFYLSIASLGSLLSWIVIPFLWLMNKAPQGDDVTRFLDKTSLSPLLVSTSAGLLFYLLFLYIKRRGSFFTYRSILKELKEDEK